jgi:hypothetical protein
MIYGASYVTLICSPFAVICDLESPRALSICLLLFAISQLYSEMCLVINRFHEEPTPEQRIS